jgi:hypothetical protein
MNTFKYLLSLASNFFGFLTVFFKEKNQKNVQERKARAADEKFKNVAKAAISKKDIRKMRDFLSE